MIVTAEGTHHSESVAPLKEGLVYCHGSWYIAKSRHLLAVWNRNSEFTLLWNCAGWGAAVLNEAGQSYSIYCDGRITREPAYLPFDRPSGSEQTLESESNVLNVACQLRGELLRLTNCNSDVSFSLSSLNDELLFDAPLAKMNEPCNILERLPREAAPKPKELHSPEITETTGPETKASDAKLIVHSTLRGEVHIPVPFLLNKKMRKALIHLAKHGDASHKDLQHKKVAGRSALGVMSTLQENFQRHGLSLIGIRDTEAGKQYTFRYEELP